MNLTLEVGSRRADGYHSVQSHMQAISLADEVRLRLLAPAAPAPRRLSLRGGGAPVGPSNLALLAAALWRGRTGTGCVAVAVRKRIPAGAGLGGGSSDAAAVLRALGRLFPGRVDEAQMLALAAALGSDVPFFAAGCASALAGGRGERLSWAPGLPAPWALVLVQPPRRLGTAAVYRAFDALGALAQGGTPAGARTRALARILATVEEGGGGDGGEQALRTLAAEGILGSDLWPAAVRLRPELKAVLDRLRRAAGPDRPVAMTGSGSALFAVVEDSGRAAHAARALANDGLWTRVATPLGPRSGQE